MTFAQSLTYSVSFVERVEARKRFQPLQVGHAFRRQRQFPADPFHHGRPPPVGRFVKAVSGGRVRNQVNAS